MLNKASFSFLSLFFLSRLATAASLPPPPSTHLDGALALIPRALEPITNISANLPPSDFHLTLSLPGPKPLPSRTILYLILHAVADLAQEPYDSVTATSLVIKKSNSGGIMLVLSDPEHPQGGFKVKEMVWGLLMAARWMDARGEWQNHRFQLSWRGKGVGNIIFVAGGGGGDVVDDGGGAGVTAREVLEGPAVPTTMNFSANAVLDFRTGWDTSPTGAAHIPFIDVMMALISGFSDLAPHNMDERVETPEWGTSWPPYEASVRLKVVGPGAGLVPAWWTCAVVHRALGALGEWYLGKRESESRGAFVLVLIDGRAVGQGGVFGGGGAVAADSAQQDVATA
ncbi:MAG: hypothetical protein Q9220_003907 [cf. Caloplaca sp. 1 TL-2023]